MPISELASALRAHGVPEVLEDDTTRWAYSSDASLYRVQPRAVVRPRHEADVLATLETCRELGVPITARGGGTSTAGNSLGPGVVLDFSRHMNRVLELDPDSRTALVEPGAVHSTLQRRALAAGLRFGPDPSTHTRCTIGGMIGNNACGSRTLAYGRTVDNVEELDVVTAGGTRMHLTGDSTPVNDQTTGVRGLVAANLATLRTEFGTFGRQVSGYGLEHLLPERGFDLRRALVGSEGTLAVVLGARVGLVVEPAHRVLLVLGYPDVGSAGDAVTAVLEHRPTACEGIDSRIVDVVVQRKGPGAVPPLPAGTSWLFVEISGDDLADVEERVAGAARSSGAVEALVVRDVLQAAALWRIREDGAGLAGRSPAGLPAHSGWEDAAVPPASLGTYLREFDALMLAHGLTGFPYGHFGDGCLHVRLDLPLDRPDGRARFRDFLTDAADLVVSHGGSLSGEHGDGRARSELLPKMYSPEALAVFAGLKHLMDPDAVLNPGVLVDPRPFDADVRVAEARPVTTLLGFGYLGDGGDFTQAVHRCTGVGKCRVETPAAGGVMCPSYLATREEKDSTRGRARVLQEMVNGATARGGSPDWTAPAVHDALDLCLSCKGCHSDCPTSTDMATFKSEVLHQTYRRRLRPRAHYSLGWLPFLSRIAELAPRAANRAMALPGLGRVALRLAGVDRRRTIPAFAPQTFRAWFAAHERSRAREQPAGGSPVVLWVDSFTEHFTPDVGKAAVRVLEDAGYRVSLPAGRVCCGLTLISTGQLDGAKRHLRRSLAALAPAVAAGTPVVGLEPSCTGVLRSDAVELLGETAAGPTSRAVRTLAELLAATPGWQAPDLTGTRVVAQPHCHHHAVMGWSPDAALLQDTGADVERLGGCCGLAGNFGVERGHYEVSVAVAQTQLLPAVEAAGADDVVLADGYSCRTQISDLTDRRGVHLAELLDPAARD